MAMVRVGNPENGKRGIPNRKCNIQRMGKRHPNLDLGEISRQRIGKKLKLAKERLKALLESSTAKKNQLLICPGLKSNTPAMGGGEC